MKASLLVLAFNLYPRHHLDRANLESLHAAAEANRLWIRRNRCGKSAVDRARTTHLAQKNRHGDPKVRHA
jgi:hypothetical protein